MKETDEANVASWAKAGRQTICGRRSRIGAQKEKLHCRQWMVDHLEDILFLINAPRMKQMYWHISSAVDRDLLFRYRNDLDICSDPELF